MALETSVAQYEALHEYASDDGSSDVIPLNKGDILEVRLPIDSENGTMEEPKDWVQGTNVTSGQHGYFPGNFVRFIGVTTLKKPQPQPRMSKDNNDSGYCGSPQGRRINADVIPGVCHAWDENETMKCYSR
ncbi:hypothetical protein CAPTEDRAFT_208679 [Capitella teleta]|uniref:SH3 domain-containing protein n=1 Tax=Capitella teleta TaxID=283909 RepID=R7TWQ5_CAPTE|nr:hypothetical protein CAPTEDRAFT_208679 [Capitella teleta]|eukprot:ELT95405.1 hypothetical protein CAPTEDRAFT_208679 [Capitella teleta]